MRVGGFVSGVVLGVLIATQPAFPAYGDTTGWRHFLHEVSSDVKGAVEPVLEDTADLILGLVGR